MRLISILLISLVSASCTMPSKFRPARTMDAGEAEYSLEMQMFVLEPGLFSPMPERAFSPSFHLRYGILDRLEFGAHLSFLTLGGDLTIQLIETRPFDLAVGIDSTFYAFPKSEEESEIDYFSVSTPVILGLNLHERFSWIAYGAPVRFLEVWVWQFGTGIDLQLTNGFGIRPQLSAIMSREQSSSRKRNERKPILYMFGLELVFGSGRGGGPSSASSL